MKKAVVCLIVLAGVLAAIFLSSKEPKLASSPAKPALKAAPQEGKFIPLPLNGSHHMALEANPRVTIIWFGEYGDIISHKLAKDLQEIASSYHSLTISFRHAPQSGGVGLNYAIAAEAAARQGKFWEFHHLALSYPPEALPKAENLAEKVGLDIGLFQEDLISKPLIAKVYKDLDMAKMYGLTNTPALIINGRKIAYLGSNEDLKKAIMRADNEAQVLLKEGTPKAKIYETILAKNGAGWDTEYAAGHGGRQLLIPSQEFSAYGSDDPLFWVYYFTSFTTPFDQDGWLLLTKLKEQYGANMRLIFLPFADGLNPASEAAALCGYWALTQQNFWEIGGLLSGLTANFTANDLRVLKNKEGTILCPSQEQLEQFNDLLASAGELKKKMGLKANPALLINGINIPIVKEFAYLEKILLPELALAKSLKDKGYHDQELLIELTLSPTGK